MTQGLTTEPGAIYSRWGKAPPGGARFHLLVWHLLDVAAVAYAVLDQNALLRRRLAELLEVDERDVIRVMSFVVGLHDIGKAAGAFQGLRPDVAKRLTGKVDPGHWMNCRHSDLTVPILQRAGVRLTGAEWALLDAVAGHHGRPAQSLQNDLTNFVCEDDAVVVSEMVEALRRVTGWRGELDSSSGVPAASWLVAGLVVLADWIGSDESVFPRRSERHCARTGIHVKGGWSRRAR